MKVDLGKNARLVLSLWRYVVTSFRCGVSSFLHTDTPSRLVVFRGRLGKLPVRLVVLRARHICLSFHFVVSMWRFIVSTLRLIEAIIQPTLHEALLDAAKLCHSRGASFRAGGFSLLSPPPSPRSLCQPSTRPRPSRANPRWRFHYEFRFFRPSNSLPTTCLQARISRIIVRLASEKLTYSQSTLSVLALFYVSLNYLLYN